MFDTLSNLSEFFALLFSARPVGHFLFKGTLVIAWKSSAWNWFCDFKDVVLLLPACCLLRGQKKQSPMVSTTKNTQNECWTGLSLRPYSSRYTTILNCTARRMAQIQASKLSPTDQQSAQQNASSSSLSSDNALPKPEIYD